MQKGYSRSRLLAGVDEYFHLERTAWAKSSLSSTFIYHDPFKWQPLSDYKFTVSEGPKGRKADVNSQHKLDFIGKCILPFFTHIIHHYPEIKSRSTKGPQGQTLLISLASHCPLAPLSTSSHPIFSLSGRGFALIPQFLTRLLSVLQLWTLLST